MSEHRFQPESLMMSHGYRPDWSEGAVKCPIFQTSTFVFPSAEAGKEAFVRAYGLRPGEPLPPEKLIYSRLNNPNLEILEDRLCIWEGAEACAVFASGIAAISTTLLAWLRPGDVLLHSMPLYGGTDHLMHHVLDQFGIQTLAFLPGQSEAEIRARVAEAGFEGRVGMVYVETPANPTLDLIDLDMCRRLANVYSSASREVVMVVDNTYMGPIWSHPLRHGADLVLYSATKYLGGHSDLIAGACLGSAAHIGKVKGLRTFLGSMPDPHTCWLLMRSLETLKLRMEAQARNAAAVAGFLASHPFVEKVYYLGHVPESDPQYAIFKKQYSSAGAMLAFDVRGGEQEAFDVLNALKMIKLAVSLGSTESLAEHPATMTHADVPEETKLALGISHKMIRLSVGVEDAQDLVHDLSRALHYAAECSTSRELSEFSLAQ